MENNTLTETTVTIGYDVHQKIEQIAEAIRSGHHVWGGSVGAEAIKDELSEQRVYEVASPDNEGEDDIQIFDNHRDAAWNLVRRSGGAVFTITPKRFVCANCEGAGCNNCDTSNPDA